MQTFLPHPDFVESAGALDDRRLGKQRVECLQILNALHQVKFTVNMEEPVPIDGTVIPWVNHPVVSMWRGYEVALAEYGITICEEWRSRGFADRVQRVLEVHLDLAANGDFEMGKPPWFGGPIHDQYKAILYRKDPDFYSQFGKYAPLVFNWPA